MSDRLHPVTGEPLPPLPKTVELPCRHICEQIWEPEDPATLPPIESAYCSRPVQLTVERAEQLQAQGRTDEVRCLEHSGKV